METVRIIFTQQILSIRENKMELYLLVPDCKCNKLRGAETLVRVKVSSPGFGTPAPVFTSR